VTYIVRGLSPEPFRHLFGLGDAELAARRARRVTAAGPGYPCRVSLEEAREGERLILLNYASHDVETPFRTTDAIYVREAAAEAPLFTEAMPPLLDARTLSLRAFDTEGMLCAARIAVPGEADAAVRDLLEEDEVATIHAHNAAQGCFLARIGRTASA